MLTKREELWRRQIAALNREWFGKMDKIRAETEKVPH